MNFFKSSIKNSIIVLITLILSTGSFLLLKDTSFVNPVFSFNKPEVIETVKDIRADVQPELTVDQSVEKFKEIDLGKPVRLSIPRLMVNVAVADGEYKAGEWTLADDKAFYATMTKKVNEPSGHTLIYGHNIPAVFWNTKDLRDGDKMVVYTDKGNIAEFTYTGSELVLPTHIEIFNYNGEPRVTLLTCNGWLNGKLDEYRRLMYFKFDKVISEQV
jgi:sortase (surface protein transpeptidase)